MDTQSPWRTMQGAQIIAGVATSLYSGVARMVLSWRPWTPLAKHDDSRKCHFVRKEDVNCKGIGGKWRRRVSIRESALHIPYFCGNTFYAE